jgi:hypothetical protein
VKETWKSIFDGYYEVSDLGKVRRAKPGPHTRVGKLVKIGYKSSPYGMVVLSANCRRKTCYVHILVARAFLGPCPRGKEVNHRDGKKKNCRLGNLEYLTRRQNVQHAIKLGLTVPVCKLSEKEVGQIRAEYTPRIVTQRMLAERFKVSESAIWFVLHRWTWK